MRLSLVIPVLIFVIVTACESPPLAVSDPLGAAPADFAMELTVLVGEGVESQSEEHPEQSRFVLFADGSLHFESDPDHRYRGDWLPPLVRVLNRKQVAEIWSLAQQIGFTDPTAGIEPVNLNLVELNADEIVSFVKLYAHEDCWCFVKRSTGDQQLDQVMHTLVEHFAQLAWTSDTKPVNRYGMPKRYDFGPDPYARYREQDESN